MGKEPRQRLHLLDAVRGFLLINMIAYHGLWDLVYLFGLRAPWYVGLPGYLWQQSICWTFLLLSGFCWHFSRSPLKRGLVVFAGGAAVSLVTLLFMPENRVLSGVLTCIGSSMLLMIPAEKLLRKVPAPVGLALSLGLFALLRNCPSGSLGFEGLVLAELPRWLYRNDLTAYFGFPGPGFFSTDYFPLIPWFFLFGAGYFLSRLLTDAQLTEKLFARGRIPVLNWVGRNSLILYLLHQPVLYGLCTVGQLLIT